MSARVVYPNGQPISAFCLSNPSDHEQGKVKRTPGTLWERLAERHAVYRSPRPYSAADKVQLAARIERVADSEPELDRYLLALGIGKNSMHSARDTVRRMLAESRLERAKTQRRYTLEEVAEEFGLTTELELERAKAAHPAGKGRQGATDE